MPRPRWAEPTPRVATRRPPSGLHAVWRYSIRSRSVVSRVGVPPPAGTVHTAPPSWSSQVVKATLRPSGDQAGAYSKGPNPSEVSRSGSPDGRSCTQIRPTAWKARRAPSGEAVYHRRKRDWNGSSSIRKSARDCSETVRSTRAENGRVATAPSATSSRRIFPPCEITIAEPSSVQSYPGRIRSVLIPSALSTVIGSMTTRSLPVSRSRSQSAVRGPYRCPFQDTVPLGMRRAKASHRPSGEISGA